jgi:predicted AlkP superfamily pyrophosphatase or phosphodiesterase
VEYVGHEFGPRSREIQDILLRLDKDLGVLFAHLDRKVGRGNYVIALSADHGVAPIPEDMQKTGADAGVLHLPEVQERIERALESFSYAKPAVARISGSDLYFAPGVYKKLQADSNAMHLVIDAIRAVPGVAAVYRAEDLRDRPATQSPTLRAFANGYFTGRSADLFIMPKPYWLLAGTPIGKSRSYDQHVPVLLMGFGIQPGQYFQPVTPADIAPTFAALCGITLSSSDGRVLAEALKNSSGRPIASRPAQAPLPKQP